MIYISTEEYLSHLSSIIQKEGVRDRFVIDKRMKQLNKENPHNVVICHCETKRGLCQVCYGLIDSSTFYGLYEFKLGRAKKEETIRNVLQLDKWNKLYSQTIRATAPKKEEIKRELISWADNFKADDENLYNHFINTLQVFYKYTGQLTVYYKELNGESVKIKPVIQLHKPVLEEEILEYAKKKSKELWNREFTCNIQFVNTYWKVRLGTYYPETMTIKFSMYMNATLSPEKIYDTLLHEMVHWHLHTSGKSYDDEDFEFIEECLRVGCSLSEASSAQRAYRVYLESRKENVL